MLVAGGVPGRRSMKSQRKVSVVPLEKAAKDWLPDLG